MTAMARQRPQRGRVLVALLSGALVLAGCTVGAGAAPRTFDAVAPAEPVTVLARAGAVPLAVAASTLLFRHASVVVLAPDGDTAAQAMAASAAVALGAPLMLAPADGTAGPDDDAVRAELVRLGSVALLTVGAPAQAWAAASGIPATAAPADPDTLAELLGRELGAAREVDAAGLTAGTAGLGRAPTELLRAGAPPDGAGAGSGELPATAPADPLGSVLVLATPAAEHAAAAATARAAGARVHVLASSDPRADPALIRALAAEPPAKVVGLGSGFGSVGRLAARLAVARTGVELPGGGQLVFPGRRMVALYGNPTTPLLGVLGEQGADASVARARALAAQYEPFSADPVVPAFEIITTVASNAPGPDGDFSNEADISDLRPYVDAAGAAGMYVVLDLQPGRSDFLTQARRYAELLAEPHVGLALDPEWRLGSGQQPLAQIGSVGAAEVNTVIHWLADLTRERHLPQKLLLLHQFRTDMITDRARVDTGRDEVAVLVHADGFGAPSSKLETWNALRAAPLKGAWWGWKNFYDEDQPTLSPQQTLAVPPEAPVFVSYQ